MDLVGSLFILIAFLAGSFLGRLSGNANFVYDPRLPSDEEVLRYWHKSRPIPAGWELADDLANCHHGEHAIIIRETHLKPGTTMWLT